MFTTNNEEKILFNQTRNSKSKLARARSHLNFFTKCLEKNVHPKNLDNKSEHFKSENDYRKGKYLQNTFQTKGNRIRGGDYNI